MKKIMTITIIGLAINVQAQKIRLSSQLFINGASPKLNYQENNATAKKRDGSKKGIALSASAEWIEHHHFGMTYGHANHNLLIEGFQSNYAGRSFYVEKLSASYASNELSLNYRYDMVVFKKESSTLKFTPTFDLGLSFMGKVDYNATYYDKSKVTSSQINLNSGELLLDLTVGFLTSTTHKPYVNVKNSEEGNVQGLAQLGFAWELAAGPANLIMGYKYGLNKQGLDQWKDSNTPLNGFTAKTSHSAWYMGVGFHFGEVKKAVIKD